MYKKNHKAYFDRLNLKQHTIQALLLGKKKN